MKNNSYRTGIKIMDYECKDLCKTKQSGEIKHLWQCSVHSDPLPFSQTAAKEFIKNDVYLS